MIGQLFFFAAAGLALWAVWPVTMALGREVRVIGSSWLRRTAR